LRCISFFGNIPRQHGNPWFMSSKAKILVVDDEMPVATMMAFLLARVGCEVKTALNVEKALRLAHAERFDLITLDVTMPGATGFELFRCLKEIPHLSNTPIVFVSGQATIENQQFALDELGAADFIEKPFGTSDFVSRILSLVEETATA
ncbi:MAG: response regulator, partial [Verrucomicrobia bacterium]|nr:response regulator [Verrucomicrobiota bacterium]